MNAPGCWTNWRYYTFHNPSNTYLQHSNLLLLNQTITNHLFKIDQWLNSVAIPRIAIASSAFQRGAPTKRGSASRVRGSSLSRWRRKNNRSCRLDAYSPCYREGRTRYRDWVTHSEGGITLCSAVASSGPILPVPITAVLSDYLLINVLNSWAVKRETDQILDKYVCCCATDCITWYELWESS